MNRRHTKYFALLACVLGLAMCFTGCEDEDNVQKMGNWVEAGDFPGINRAGAVSFKLYVDGQERVYIGTGANTRYQDDRERLADFFYVYPVSKGERFGTMAWSPADAVAPMPSAAPKRNGAVAFALNGKGYVGTGYDGSTYLKDFWCYDPKGVTPYTKEEEEYVIDEETGKFVIDEETGLEKKQKVTKHYEYEGTWTRVKDYPTDTCRYAVAFVLKDPFDGKEWAYVGTGEDFLSQTKTTFKRFDGEKWENVDGCGVKRCQAVALVANGYAANPDASVGEPEFHEYAYLIGGLNNGIPEYRFERYNPWTKKWEELNQLRDHTKDNFDDDYLNLAMYGSTGFTIGDSFLADGQPNLDQRLYITTGGPGYASTLTWEYNPYYDYWLQKTSFEGTARKFATGFTLHYGTDRIEIPYVTLGTDGDLNVSGAGGQFYGDVRFFRPYEPYEPLD